jgi:hypothetical protein
MTVISLSQRLTRTSDNPLDAVSTATHSCRKIKTTSTRISEAPTTVAVKASLQHNIHNNIKITNNHHVCHGRIILSDKSLYEPDREITQIKDNQHQNRNRSVTLTKHEIHHTNQETRSNVENVDKLKCAPASRCCSQQRNITWKKSHIGCFCYQRPQYTVVRRP